MVLNSNAGRGKLTAPLALALLCICVVATAQGQNSSRSTPVPGTPLPGATGVFPGAGTPSERGYEEPQSMRVLRQNARRDDIKKRMEQNATRLLLLTAELRNDLRMREPNEADNKRLDEIAKLAHAVREQMKQ